MKGVTMEGYSKGLDEGNRLASVMATRRVDAKGAPASVDGLVAGIQPLRENAHLVARGAADLSCVCALVVDKLGALVGSFETVALRCEGLGRIGSDVAKSARRGQAVAPAALDEALAGRLAVFASEIGTRAESVIEDSRTMGGELKAMGSIVAAALKAVAEAGKVFTGIVAKTERLEDLLEGMERAVLALPPGEREIFDGLKGLEAIAVALRHTADSMVESAGLVIGFMEGVLRVSSTVQKEVFEIALVAEAVDLAMRGLGESAPEDVASAQGVLASASGARFGGSLS